MLALFLNVTHSMCALSVVLLLLAIAFWRHFDTKRPHRSVWQALILLLYHTIRFFWAIVRGIDMGYLEFRRVMRETPIETGNERELGKLLCREEAA